MSDDTRAVLLRLKRRIGREAALHERFEREAYAKGNAMSRERAYGEANVLRMAQDFIDDELRKVAKR